MMGAIGGAVGNKPFALLLKYYNWRIAVLKLSYVGFILAIMIAILIKNQPKNTNLPILHIKDKNFFMNNLKTVINNKENWMIGIYSFLVWAQVLGFAILWGIPFLKLNYNLDNIKSTNAIGYIWIGIAIGSPIIGWISDYIRRRCIVMTACGILGAVSMFLVIILTNIPLIFLNILMISLGISSAGQTLPFALIRDNHSLQNNSTANGFNNLCIVFGGVFFPLLIGKILDFYWIGNIEYGIRVYNVKTYQIALSILPICYLIAALISAFFIKETFCKCSPKK